MLVLNSLKPMLVCVRASRGRLELSEPNYILHNGSASVTSDASGHTSPVADTAEVLSQPTTSSLEHHPRNDTSYVTPRPPLSRHISANSRLADTSGCPSSNFIDLTSNSRDTSESGLV